MRSPSAFLALALLSAGCSIGATAELPRPVSGSAPPNVVAIPTVGAELLGFQAGELVSRASLVRMDRDATCFDLVVRVPRGLVAGAEDQQKWHLTLEVDGKQSARFDLPLRRCDGAACLPAGSTLERFALGGDPNVAPLGERFCVEHVPVARHELALVEHEPVGTATFRFHFTDGRATASR
jgi:hypothetical protein